MQIRAALQSAFTGLAIDVTTSTYWTDSRYDLDEEVQTEQQTRDNKAGKLPNKETRQRDDSIVRQSLLREETSFRRGCNEPPSDHIVTRAISRSVRSEERNYADE